jgi:hypothetical protein
MNNSSLAGLQAVIAHATIPAAPVALGQARWGGQTEFLDTLQVSVIGDEPPRFSVRAQAAGRAEESAYLAGVEEIGLQLSAASSPSRFNVQTWERILTMVEYPEHALVPLLQAMRQGASIDPSPEELLGPCSISRNHGSLYAHVPFVATKLGKQLRAATLMRWPDGSTPHVVAPLGVVTKFKKFADSMAHEKWLGVHCNKLQRLSATDLEACLQGHWTGVLSVNAPLPTPPQPVGSFSERLIHDARQGINDRGEPPPMEKLHTLRQIAHAARPGDFTWVEDISGAFKLVKILGWQTILTGTAALGVMTVDTCLTFGLNMSPQVFQGAVGHPLLWTAMRFLAMLGIAGVLFQYVDDHIGLAHCLEDAKRQRAVFRTVCRMLNIPLDEGKAKEPAQSNLILGLILHTAGTVRVECPPDKLEWIREILAAAECVGNLTVKQLETVCGMIGFIAVSIHGALVFSAELRDALRRAKASGTEFVGLSAPIQEDIRFWRRFASEWNGMEVVLADSTVPEGHFSADAMTTGHESAIGVFACGWGFRIPINLSRWAQGHQPRAATDIAILELIAYALQVVVIAALFPGSCSAVSIPGVTDNSGVRARISRGWCRDPLANSILRFVWRVSTFARVNCRISWIPSEQNTLSDAPSRNDQHSFSSAMSVYVSYHFANCRAAPAWWPRDIRYGPEAGRPFAVCDADSPLGALAEHLGTANVSQVQYDAQQVAVLLSRVRALFV